MPMIKPSKAKLTQLRIKNKIIMPGCKTLNSTNSVEVHRMISPINSDFVAAAPTYPRTISKKLTGAESNSYIVPTN